MGKPELGTIISCIIGAVIWWLLTSHPTFFVWTFVGVVSFCALGVLVWRVFRAPDADREPEPKAQVLSPIPTAGVGVKNAPAVQKNDQNSQK
jgi:hypothetical protein